MVKQVRYYRVPEALTRARISRATLYRWFASGRVPEPGQRDRNGHRIFSQQELEALIDYVNSVIPVHQDDHLSESRGKSA